MAWSFTQDSPVYLQIAKRLIMSVLAVGVLYPFTGILLSPHACRTCHVAEFGLCC